MWLFESLENQVTFIVGSAKNAGKTTFLNLAARHLRSKSPVTLMSVGVDGERQDLLYGNPKPLVPVEAGDLVVTTENALRAGGCLFSTLAVSLYRTVLGRIVVAKAMRSGFVELIGPETNAQLKEIVDLVLGEFGAKTVLIDGAVNRITQVSASAQAGIVDVVKVTPANATSMLDHVRTMSLLARIPVLPARVAALPSLPPGWEEVEGAFTRDKLLQRQSTVPPKGLLVQDFSRVFLEGAELRHLDTQLFFRDHFELRAIILNTHNLDEKEFLSGLREDPILPRIVINPYKELST